MGTVVDIHTRRAREPVGNRPCPECGEEWWSLAVVVSRESRIVGSSTQLKCTRCGHQEEL